MMKRLTMSLFAMLALASGAFAVGTGTLDRTSGWYAAGIDLTVNAAAGADSFFDSWTGDTGGATISGTQITFNVSGPKAITGNFSHITHNIAASAGPGGSISPSGTVPVEQGANQAFTITPNVNYHILDVTTNGISVGAVAGFTFTNVQAPRSIAATFAIDQRTITFDSAGGTAVASITDDIGAAVTPPAPPTRTGFTFAGWSPSLPATMPTTDLTVTAQWTINQYTITFNSAGGTAVTAITQNFGSAVTAPANPTRAGYTFAGWSPVVPGTMPASDTTCTATWTINQYTITFDSAGGSAVTAITQNFDTSVTAPANPTKAGYTFSGWSPVVPGTMPSSDTTCTAQWTVNQYTITFDSAGGTAVTAITQDFGATVTAPAAPTKTGYTFAGWSPVVPGTMPSSDTTCTATWTINQYTITFDSAGGSAVTAITQNFDTSVTAPANPTKAGYTFSGWSPVVPGTMPSSDTTCTAQWTVNQYTITFDSAGGTAVAAITDDFGATVTAPAAPTKTGYTFSGWSPVVPGTMPSSDTTCTAQWTINQYTITFDSAGGTAVAAITDDFGATVTAPAAPTKAGYTFAGWSPVVPGTMPSSDTTCTAQWTINTYTITFDSAGGTAVAAITDDFGATVTAPAAPTKTGYTFAGWSPVVPGTMPSSDTTCTAQWTINTYTLTVVSEHGTADPATQTYNWNTSVDASITDSPVILTGNTTQYVCTGWIGTGSVTSGSGTNTTFTITEDSQITWQWQTNYWVDFTVIGN